jgi:hypothetical protein
MKHSQPSRRFVLASRDRLGVALALGLGLVIALGVALGGCGKKADKPGDDQKTDAGTPSDTGDAGSGSAAIAASDVPELGVDQIRRFNYPYGDGAAAFTKATAAYKAKPRDWAAVRSHAEAALAKDPYHLDAHRMLAAAMAQDGDYTQASTHLLTAMAADWQKHGVTAPADPDLAGFWASPAGAKVTATGAKIKEAFLAKAASGLWLLGRRSTFKLPEKSGVQAATTRGELYAYDREGKRFLRLSQTDHSVAGFLRSPSGKELVLIGFDKLEIPAGAVTKPTPSGGAVTKPDTGGTGDPAPAADPMPTEEAGGVPTAPAAPAAGRPAIKIARAFAVVLDAATLEPIGKRTTLPKGEQVAVGYATGERLVAIATATGTWDGGGEAQWLAIDTTTGKTAKTQPATLERLIAISADGGDLLTPIAGLRASPETGANVAELSTEAGNAIPIPDGAPASRRSLSMSPDKARLAFATSPDPCNPDAAPSLYVADTATGAPKHLLTGKSRFLSRWLDATTLAYEDPEGGVRFWDATTGRESQRLADKGGLALAFLAGSAAPACVPAPQSQPE